jgi:hypothetical protein
VGGRSGTANSGCTPSETLSTDIETCSFPALPQAGAIKSNAHRVGASAVQSLFQDKVSAILAKPVALLTTASFDLLLQFA